jgi:cation diffusion facilitator family transporter
VAEEPHHDHDDAVDHDREHRHQPASAEHKHGVPLARDRGALRVVAVSSLVLGVVAALELTAAAVSGSAAVLADGLHNLGDVSTTVALAAAFILSRRAPTRRFPYGYHRGEDLAGIVVLGLIVASAVASGVTSIEHLVHGQVVSNFAIAIATAAVGFVGNEAVAQYKIRAGRRMSSMSLVADGQHSRLDGLASLGAAAGVIGAALGAPILDPIAGLVITAVIAVIAWDTARTVTGRLLDEADASLVATIEAVAQSTPGVVAVNEARARWTGRRVLAELTLALPPDSTLAGAHALGEEVRHRLYHQIDTLADVIVHLDPAGDDAAHQAVSHHRELEPPERA